MGKHIKQNLDEKQVFPNDCVEKEGQRDFTAYTILNIFLHQGILTKTGRFFDLGNKSIYDILNYEPIVNNKKYEIMTRDILVELGLIFLEQISFKKGTKKFCFADFGVFLDDGVLIIEVDEKHHKNSKKIDSDKENNMVYKNKGCRVLRLKVYNYTNPKREIRENLIKYLKTLGYEY